MSVLEIALPLRLVSEANTREHRRTKARRVAEHRRLVRMILSAPLVASGILSAMGACRHVVVTITRLGPCRFDDDNNVGAAKALRDGIADAFGVDDGGSRLVWRYAQRKSKTYGVVLGFEVLGP